MNAINRVTNKPVNDSHATTTNEEAVFRSRPLPYLLSDGSAAGSGFLGATLEMSPVSNAPISDATKEIRKKNQFLPMPALDA
jgi:hypothetical protein